VAQALGIERIGLYLDLDRPLEEEERATIRALVSRRREREPVAYILGYRDFYGRRFIVSPSVLIPRPDTETLVERALDSIPTDAPCRVLDVGTGSGAIALTIAAERPLATVTATDVSEAALSVAESNRESLGLTDRVTLQRADFVDPIGDFDVVVCNPPYVSTAELAALEPEVRDHEPNLALEGGADGLFVVRALFDAMEPVTRPPADMFVEVGAGQAEEVSRLARERGTWEAAGIHHDLQGMARVVHLRRT